MEANLDDLRESLQEASIGIAVDLNGVEQIDFRFGTIAEYLEDRSVSLSISIVGDENHIGQTDCDELDDSLVGHLRLDHRIERLHEATVDPFGQFGLGDRSINLLSLEVVDDLSVSVGAFRKVRV